VSLQIVRAESVRAAAAFLASDPAAVFLAGGTLAVRAWNSGGLAATRMLLSDGLGLGHIRVAGGTAEIGAAVTMAEILRTPELQFLHVVAREIGGPAVRAMATVGGNLFAPYPFGDFGVALLAMDAEVILENAGGTKRVPLEVFYSHRERSRDLVGGVSFGLPPSGAFRFSKVVRRRPHGASVLSIACLLPWSAGRIRGARVAYGAMAPMPIRSRAVEGALEGRMLEGNTIAAARAVALEDCAPVDDPQASAWYRREVLPVHLGRLLETHAGY
jgi:CO/xanthine dehydrogenase FAD-binding subunit